MRQEVLAAAAVLSSDVGPLADGGRFLAFVGLVALVGAGLWAMSAPRVLGDAPATRVVLVAGLVTLAGGTAIGGRMLLLRLGLLAIAAVLLAARSRRAQRSWRAAAVVTSLAIVVTFSASGHAGTESPSALWIAIDAIHLASTAVWLGGLVLLTLGGVAWLRDESAEPTVRRFSASATVLVPVIVVTGVAVTLRLIDGLDGVRGLTESSWGRTLLVKLSVVVALVALAAVSRWLLHQSGAMSLRRILAAEAIMGLVVLGVTAGLVSQPPRPVGGSSEFQTTVIEAGVLTDITVTPTRVGANDVHVYITPPGSSITPIVGVTGAMRLPGSDVPDVELELEDAGRNHVSGTVTIPASGDWTLELIVEVSPGATVPLRAVVPIP